MDNETKRQIIGEIGEDGLLAYLHWKDLLFKTLFAEGTPEELDVLGAQELEAWKAFEPFLVNLRTDIHDPE